MFEQHVETKDWGWRQCETCQIDSDDQVSQDLVEFMHKMRSAVVNDPIEEMK